MNDWYRLADLKRIKMIKEGNSHYLLWDNKQCELLLKLYNAGETWDNIGFIMNRPKSACKSRLNHMKKSGSWNIPAGNLRQLKD